MRETENEKKMSELKYLSAKKRRRGRKMADPSIERKMHDL